MSNSPKNSKASVKPKSGHAKVSTKAKKTIVTPPSRSKSKQTTEKIGKLLTSKQELFCLEVSKGLSQADAYRVAYAAKNMTAETIQQCASRLMANRKVTARVRQLQDDAAKKAVMTSADVLREAMRLARFDIRKLYRADGSPVPIHELDDETASAVQAVDIHEEYIGSGEDRVFVGYTKKYKIADKNAALEKLFKHFGLYEKDNAQKTDPITEFLMQCSGKSLPIIPE